MKPCRATLGFVLLASIVPFFGCTDAYKQRYIAKHVLGLSEDEVKLAGRAKSVPFEDLNFDINIARKTFTIQISSGKWEILGFGTGCAPTETTNELMLSGIAGIPNPSGGMKSHTDQRIPGRKLHVTFLNEDGTKREIFHER
jgi:hypothetical protein